VLRWLRSGDDPWPWNKVMCLKYCSEEVVQWINAQPDEEKD